MPFLARITATATAVLAATGFLLAPAAHAATRPPVQVNGIKLLSALLPASSFGPDFQFLLWQRSGKSLWHQRATTNPLKMSCGGFEAGTAVTGFGESAVAVKFVANPNPWPAWPNTQFFYSQSVYQFASTKAATTYYGQARAKYAACKDFTESVPADSVPGSGKLETTTLTMSKTSVGKYQAFRVGQMSDLTEIPGITIQLNTLVTIEGADVITIVSVGGTNDPVSAGLMLKLIGRVQKLH